MQPISENYVVRMTSSTLLQAARVLENIFQRELHDTGSNRCARDHTECTVGYAVGKRRTRIQKLRVIEGIEELRAELQICVFPESSNSSVLHEGKVPVKLAGAKDRAAL